MIARAALLALGLSACADTADFTTQHQAIAGRTDTTRTFAVMIRVVRPEGVATCSGALVSARTVLTARHCVAPLSRATIGCDANATTAGDAFPASSFHVSAETTWRASTEVSVRAVHVPSEPTLCGADLALLELDAVPLAASIAFVSLESAPALNAPFSFTGYGLTAGDASDAFTRRTADALRITALGPITHANNVTLADAREWMSSAGPCAGDSGGPAVNANGAVTAVFSRGDDTCSQPVFTRLDSHAAWLRSTVRAIAMQSGTALPAWVDGTTPPPPPPACNAAPFTPRPLAVVMTALALWLCARKTRRARVHTPIGMAS